MMMTQQELLDNIQNYAEWFLLEGTPLLKKPLNFEIDNIKIRGKDHFDMIKEQINQLYNEVDQDQTMELPSLFPGRIEPTQYRMLYIDHNGAIQRFIVDSEEEIQAWREAFQRENTICTCIIL